MNLKTAFSCQTAPTSSWICAAKVKHPRQATMSEALFWAQGDFKDLSLKLQTTTHRTKPSFELFTSSLHSWGNFSSAAPTAALINTLISLFCSTLSILCSFNKHIHAAVVSDLAPIHYLCGSSVWLCGWITQPLTGGSLWTSEHIRRQTQEPSALIMSDRSVHEHQIHFSPLSLAPYPSPHPVSLTHILLYITTNTLHTDN